MKQIYNTDKHQGFVAEGSGILKKSIYSNSDFMSKIPANKWKLIKASTNDDIEYWVDMIKMQKVIDLNSLPAWFMAGLNAMVPSIFTQEQIDTFLEV